MNIFSDQDYKFSFYYPKSWVQITPKDLLKYNTEAKIGFKKSDSINTSFVIKADSHPGAEDVDIADSIKSLKKIFSESLPDFRLIYMYETQFMNQQAIEVEYEYSILDNELGDKMFLHQKQIIFLYDETLYWLMFSSMPQEFDKDAKDFNKILDTFEIQN